MVCFHLNKALNMAQNAKTKWLTVVDLSHCI